MKLYQNTMYGLHHRNWSRSEAVTYFFKGAARELKFLPSFFSRLHEVEVLKRIKKERTVRYEKEMQMFKKNWLKQDGHESYFDFGICKLPDVSDSPEKLRNLISIFGDVLLFPCFLNDIYDRKIIEYLDMRLIPDSLWAYEGPYGYTDGIFDVTVKKGDTVIDAGAWIGDFSAYAVFKGAKVYAFEPVKETYQLLCKARDLNLSSGRIHTVQKGLGSSECEMNISIDIENSGANSIAIDRRQQNMSEKIYVTTLDKFVEEERIEQVNFIKADIEGAEREMLRGASNVLKKFAPKLAICTYHLHDDPEVLEKIILDANPNYTVVHLGRKLFAMVISE
jgi:FkbM family methyltransferase